MRFGCRHNAGACASIIAAFIVIVSARAGEPVFEIYRFAIDGGGDVHSVGGGFEISVTIGQPATGVLTGGDLQLTGGFWFQEPPGDCNRTGSTNLLDYAELVTCMSGPVGDSAAPYCACYDLDGDQDVDLRDLGEFYRSFSGA